MTPPMDNVAKVHPAGPHVIRVSTASAPAPLPGGPGAPRRTRRPLDVGHLRLVTPRRRSASPVLIVTALTVIVALFGLAAFHNLMASAQYDLERVERELQLEQARLVDLEFQVEQLNSPAKVEELARGALGMVDASGAVDLVVSSDLLAEVHAASTASSPVDGLNTDWATVKPLLGSS